MSPYLKGFQVWISTVDGVRTYCMEEAELAPILGVV
jgi:hypothetical protein